MCMCMSLKDLCGPASADLPRRLGTTPRSSRPQRRWPSPPALPLAPGEPPALMCFDADLVRAALAFPCRPSCQAAVFCRPHGSAVSTPLAPPPAPPPAPVQHQRQHPHQPKLASASTTLWAVPPLCRRWAAAASPTRQRQQQQRQQQPLPSGLLMSAVLAGRRHLRISASPLPPPPHLPPHCPAMPPPAARPAAAAASALAPASTASWQQAVPAAAAYRVGICKQAARAAHGGKQFTCYNGTRARCPACTPHS